MRAERCWVHPWRGSWELAPGKGELEDAIALALTEDLETCVFAEDPAVMVCSMLEFKDSDPVCSRAAAAGENQLPPALYGCPLLSLSPESLSVKGWTTCLMGGCVYEKEVGTDAVYIS